ncbi:MAG: acetylornithine transaminase [Armatimonadetes bacterium]|nr:acetylornithine transaminase [Armatimonadota bacterium]
MNNQTQTNVGFNPRNSHKGDSVLAHQWDADHVMTTYARYGVQFVRGEGVYLFDANGRRYLDLLAGIAVCSVGHSHPYLTRALQDQAATLLHVSNLFLTEPQARLARRLVELSDFERVFFSNSGAEANEAALKIARKRGSNIAPGKTNIVTANNSFHGRTIATVTATGQPKYSAAFAPLPGGFEYVPFNDIAALTEAVTDSTAAVMLEPVQGEGGIIPATPEYLRAARDLCDKHDALLILDEVQTGAGRTGTLWAYQQTGIVPDILTLAKGLGGGVPIGATLARGSAANTFVPGDHGTTFGGNPLATAAANAVLDILADEQLTANARDTGAYFQGRLSELAERFPETVGEVRGKGLMIGVALHRPIGKQIVKRALLDHGLVLNATSETVLRFLPPLILTRSQVDDALTILADVITAESREL